jgi:hypothetical protein
MQVAPGLLWKESKGTRNLLIYKALWNCLDFVQEAHAPYFLGGYSPFLTGFPHAP